MIESVTFKLTGITPLIFNNLELNIPTPFAMCKLEEGPRELTSEQKQAIIKSKGHFCQGHPAIPTINIRKGLEGIGSAIQVKGLTSLKKFVQDNLVTCREAYALIEPRTCKYDTRWDRINVGGKKGSQMLICRPILELPWSATVTVEYMSPVKQSHIIEAMNRLGIAGIGSYKTNYGHFSVEKV
jgi:hypothetical protein